MIKGKKTVSEHIIDLLRTGESLRLSEITDLVNEKLDRKAKIQGISSVLSRLSNTDKCELGYFIDKKKKDKKGYVYKLVGLARNLEPEQLYDLSRNSGKNRFTLKDALKKHPGLKNYTLPSKSRRVTTETAKQQPRDMTDIKSAEKFVFNENLRDLMADFVREIKDQGGLQVNVNLNLQVKEIGI